MKKDITNYLHLYYGQYATIKWKYEGAVLGEEDGIQKITSRVLEYQDCIEEAWIHCRKLSSMTEEEVIQYLRLKHNAYTGEYAGISIKDNGFWWGFKLNTGNERFRFKFYGEVIDESNADQFQYLLSSGFDLFGLIEEGLAIEKTTVGGEQ